MIYKTIKNNYNINIIDIEKTEAGLTNFNYYITDENHQKYFLKMYRKNSIEEINNEIEFINCVLNNKIKTPKIIKNIYNNDITINNGNSYVLFEYINGKHPIATDANIRKIGRLMANMHQINIECSIKQKKYSIDINHIISELKRYETKVDDELLNLFYKLIKNSQNIPFEKLPKSYNHCDIFLDNLIQKDEDIYIIDFEEVSYENSLFDISRCAFGCCRDNDTINLQKYYILINSYNNVKPLTQEEKEYLYDYTIFTGLISTFWRYMEFNIYRIDDTKKELYKELYYSIIKFIKIDKLDFYNKMFNKT